MSIYAISIAASPCIHFWIYMYMYMYMYLYIYICVYIYIYIIWRDLARWME